MRKRFQAWYAENVHKHLEEGTPLEEVKVNTDLSGIKNHCTNWIIQSWESIIQRPSLAINGLEKAGILPAIDSVSD